MPVIPRLRQFIGSAFVESTGSDYGESPNPSHPEDTVALVPSGSVEDADRAVGSALDAYSAWRSLPGPARADSLYAWSDRILARHEELAQALAREVGKPIGEARGEVSRCIAILRYYAGETVRAVGDVVPALTAGSLQYSVRQPLGVVVLITPWNFPLAIPLWKAGPALAMGNTVVLKPAEQASWCAELLAETSAGLPNGVFNVVHGEGSIVGNHLVKQPGVAAVSFTGSVAVGSGIQRDCATLNKKCQAEMGGKNAAVVVKDADLPRAAALVAGGAMRFAGQKCTATSRVVVETSVKPAFLVELRKALDALNVGPVTEPSTALGPVIEQAAQTRLLDVIANAGETREYESGAKGDGYYVPPTVFSGVDPTSNLAQHELFGPVLAVIDADDFDHAVEIANGTPFGLSTAVYTKDVALALRYIEKIEAGLVRINGDTTGVDPHAPFGGMKASSSGTREQGSVAKDFYTGWKTVLINP